MELKDLEGVGNATAEKLEEAGITIDDLAKFNLENNIDELTKLGINESQSEKILSNFTKPFSGEIGDNISGDNDKSSEGENNNKRPDLTYSNANKYIRYAFEHSDYYNEESSESEKEKQFREFVNDKL
nr:helix-hairpin-helix domain-containing protein [Methanobrevibacter arboriphilus]